MLRRRIVYIGLLLMGVLSASCGTLQKGKRPVTASDVSFQKSARESQYLFLEAVKLKNQGQMGAAFDFFNRAAVIDSSNAAALYNLAEYYINLRQPQRAYDLLERAVTIDKDNFWYNMMLANLAETLGNSERAVEIYNAMISAFPDKPELNYMLAEVYTQQNQFQKAIDALDRLELSMGTIEGVSAQKYKLYRQLKQDDKAIAEIQKLIRSNPNEVRYQILLSDIYLELGRNKEALDVLNRAAEIDPDDGALYMSRVNYFDKTGDSVAAKEQIRQALLNEKIDVDSKIKMITGYITTLIQRNDNVSQVYNLFDTLIEQHPQEAEFRRLYADFLILQKQNKRAEEQLQVVVDLDPIEAESWLRLMGLALSDSSFQKMIGWGERAMEYLPDNLEVILYTGTAYGQVKQYDKAIAILQKGIEKTPVSNLRVLSNFYGQTGDIYHQSGRKAEAYAAYDKALEYNSRNAVVLNNYSYFLSLDKEDLSKAERMSRLAIEMDPNSTYLDTYAWVFFQQGNYSLAKFYLESALEKESNPSPDLLEHYGDVLFQLGQIDEAIGYWNQALEKGSDSKVVKKKIETKSYIEP